MSGQPPIFTVEEDEEAFADSLIHGSLGDDQPRGGAADDDNGIQAGPVAAPVPVAGGEGASEEDGNLLDLDFTIPLGPMEM